MMIRLMSEDISIKLQLYVVCLTEQNISDTLDLGVPTSARTKSCHILLLEFDSDCLTQKIYKIIGHSGLPENNLVVVSLWTMSNLLRCTQTNWYTTPCRNSSKILLLYFGFDNHIDSFSQYEINTYNIDHKLYGRFQAESKSLEFCF